LKAVVKTNAFTTAFNAFASLMGDEANALKAVVKAFVFRDGLSLRDPDRWIS
jgi:hypothetical protein